MVRRSAREEHNRVGHTTLRVSGTAPVTADVSISTSPCSKIEEDAWLQDKYNRAAAIQFHHYLDLQFMVVTTVAQNAM